MVSIPEHPPPSYLDGDPDLVSLRSAAPSYTSSVPPTYTPRSYQSLLPPISTAPAPIPAHYAYNVASWPSLSNQSQSRAYLNVAARRARRAQEAAQSDLGARVLRLGEGSSSSTNILTTDTDPSTGTSTSTSSSSSSSNSRDVTTAVEMEEALRTESRAWDSFTAQMKDWEQRQVSWKAFKSRHERKKKEKGKGVGGRIRWGFYGRFG